MKRNVILYFALLALTACDNPKAIRHLLRTAQHVLQIDATQKSKEVNYLLTCNGSLFYCISDIYCWLIKFKLYL